MLFTTKRPMRFNPGALLFAAALVLGAFCGVAPVAGQSIDVPAPRSSTNAALHYQRAILFLSAVDPAQRELLLRPVWEIVTPETTEEELDELDRLLNASRHAVRSALVGAHQIEADFGLDIDQYTIASLLPHTHAMTELGRLLVLHGLKQQSNGDWESAAESYFYCLRMGRHLTQQATLAEALAGVDVLETAYFALGNWAVRCPDKALVEEALDILNAAAPDMVNPARTMRFEATISRMRLDAFQDAYPDGAWAEMALEALGADFPDGDAEAMHAAAKRAVIEAGAPKEVFDSKESFDRYMSKLRSVYVDLALESANCLTLPAPESIKCGAAVFASFSDKLLPTERTTALNPAVNAAFFAVHQTELDVLRLVVAAAAERTSEGFPASLDALKGRFGGVLPTSDYDGSAYQYELLEGGRGFSISVDGKEVAGQTLPTIRFRFVDSEE